MWPLVAPLPPSSNNANTSSAAAASSQTGGATGGILPHHPPMPLPPYHHHHPHHHMIPPPCVPPPFHPMGMPPPHLKYHPHHHSGASSSQQPHQQGQAGPHHPLLPPPPPPGLPLVGAGGTGQQQGNMYQNSFNHLPPGIPPPMPLVTGGANLNNSNSLNAPNARMNNNGNITAGGNNLNNHNNILLQGSMGAGHQGMLMNTNNQHHHHGMTGAGNLLLNNNSNPNNFTNNNLNHSSKFGVKNGLWAHNNLPNLLPGATPGNSDSAAFWNSNHNATAVSSSANLGINGGGGAFGKKFDSFSNMVTNGSHITNQQHHNTNSSLSSMFNMGALLGDNIESIWKNTTDNSLTSNINNVNDDCNNNSSAGFNPFPPPKTLGSKGSIGNFDNSHNINYNNFNTQSSMSVIQNNNNYNNTKNANNATLNKMGDMTTNSFFGNRDGTSAFDYKSTPSGSSSLLSGFENRLFPPYNNTFNGNSSETGNINTQSFDDVFNPSSLDGTNMNDSIMGGGLANKVSSNYPNTGNNYDKWNSIGSGFRGDATQNSASHTPSNASTNKSFSSAIAGAAIAEPMTKLKATVVSDDDRDITGTSLWAANANASLNNKSNTSEFLGLRSGSSGLSSAHFGENFGNPNISNNNISNNNCNNMNNGNQVEDRFTKQPRIPIASDDTFSHQLPQQTIYPTDITNLNANTNTPNNVNSFDSNTNTNVMEKSKETGGGVNDELIRQFINTTNGWGRIPIKQDTSWDMCGDDEETLTFASGPTTAVRNMGSSSCINTSSTAVCSFDPNTLGTNLWKSQNDSNSMMMAPQNTVGSVNFMLNQQMSANINNTSSLNPNLGGLQPNGMASFNATNVNVNANLNSDNFSSNISSPRSAGGSSSFMYNNTNNNNNGNSNQNENETANYWFSGGGGTSTLTKDANSDTRLPMLRQLSSSTGSSLSNNNHNNANNANNASNFFHLPPSSSTHQQTFPYNNINNNQNGNIGSESSNNNNNYSSTTSANPNNGNYNGGTKMNDYYNGNGTLVRGTSNFANTNNTNNVNNAEIDEDEDGEDGGIGVWKSVEAAKQETSMYWNPNLINDMANGESLSVLDNVPHSTTLNNRNGNSHYNAANYGGKLSSNLNDFHRSNNNNNNTYNHNNEPTIPMNSHEGVFPMYPPSNQNNANINNNNNIYANTIQSSNPRNIENNSLTSDMMLIQNQKLNASVNNMIPALKKSYSSLLNNGNSSNLSSLNQNYNSALGSNNYVHINNNNPIINSNDAKSYYKNENAASHLNNSTTIYNTNNFLSGTTTFNKSNMIPAPSLLFNNNKPSVADHHANPPMPEIDDGTDIWARNVNNNTSNMGGNNANLMMEQHHSTKFLAAGNSHPHNTTNGNKFNSNNPPPSMNHFGNNNGFNKHCNNNDVNMFQYHNNMNINNQNERNSTFNSTTEFDPLINGVFGNPGNGNNINNINITNNARIGPLFSTNKPQTTQNFMGQNAFGSMQQKTSLQNNFQNMESSLLSNSTNTVIISNGSISTPTAPHNRNANEMSITNNNATKIAPSTHYLTNCSTPNMVTATKNTNNSSNSTNNCNNTSTTNSYNNGKEDMAKLIPILSTKLSREALELLASQNAAFFEEFLHECLKLIHGNGNGNSQNSNSDWANRINVQTLQAILIELVMKKRKQQLIANNNNTSSSVVGQGHNQMSATGCGADILASCASTNNSNNNSTTNQHE